MLRSVLVLFFCVFATFKSSAQKIDFKLQDYQLTDVKFRSFNNSLSAYSIGESNSNLSADTLLNSSSHTSFNYSANVKMYTNTRQRQSLLLVNGQTYGHRLNNDQLDKTVKTRQYTWNISSSASYNNRFYVRPLLFIELEPTFLYTFYQNNTLSQSKSGDIKEQYTENRPYYDFRLPLKIGYGRLERVEDARQALFLVQQLKKSKRLSRDLSKQDMIELSSFVSKLRNKRFFDDRLQRIYQLKMIDSFYRANNYSEVLDATYYTTTMDYWMFGGTPIRNNGARVSLAVYRGIGQEKQDRTESGTSTYFKRSTAASINQMFFGPEYIVDKPISEAWQSTTSIRVYKGDRSTNNVSTFLGYDSYDTLNIKGSQLHLSQTIGYYPTTRTWLRITQQFSVSRLKVDAIEHGLIEPPFKVLDDSPFQHSVYTIDVDYNYYISPRFRFNFNMNYTHERIPDLRSDEFIKRYVTGRAIPESVLDGSGDLNPVLNYYRLNGKNNQFNLSLRITYALF